MKEAVEGESQEFRVRIKRKDVGRVLDRMDGRLESSFVVVGREEGADRFSHVWDEFPLFAPLEDSLDSYFDSFAGGLLVGVFAPDCNIVSVECYIDVRCFTFSWETIYEGREKRRREDTTLRYTLSD